MVAGSGIHTRGRKSQRSRLASTSASTLSVLILASAMARVRSGLDHHFGNKGLQQADHGPGVGGGFNGNVGAGRQMLAGEAGDGFPGGGEVVAMEDASGVVEDYGFDDFLVQIERGKWHNKFTPD